MKREGRIHDAHTKGAEAGSLAKSDRKSRKYVRKAGSKGFNKLRFCDISLENRSYSRLDGGGGRGGVSASDFARYLSNSRHDDEDEEEDEDEVDVAGAGEMVQIGVTVAEDDDLGFFQVGLMTDYFEDGWCIITEL